ncbi:paired domain-containing protein [Trichonephila clavipes]|nr:paired domain-containing protein [Trichonephila clavipes]
MSERSRLPDSLMWRAAGWMEMGLSQADAARCLNASRSVVYHLWNQYQTEASVSRRHVPGQPRAITPAGDRFSLFRLEEEEGFLCRNLLQTTL